MKLRGSSSSFHWLRFFWSFFSTYSFFGLAVAQDAFSDLPSGFYEFTTGVIGEEEEQRLGNLDFKLSIRTLYDTNVTQGNDIGPRRAESDLRVQPTLASSYEIGPGNWQLGVAGSYGRINYLEMDEFNANLYSAGLLGQYQTGKIKAKVTTRFANDAGVNRLVGAFLEQRSFSNSARINYRLSSKTSVEVSWTQQSIENQTEGFADTSSNTLNAAALWQVTPLIRLGPGFRYGVRTGFEDAEFTVAGPLLRADYNLAAKIDLTSSVGLDFSDSPAGEDKLLNWRIGLKYRASALWGVNLEMVRDTQATLITGGGFDQISSYSLGYNRKIRRANLRLSVAYIDRDPQGSAGAALAFRDSTSVDYTASLGLPVIGDEVDLNVNLVWRDFTTTAALQSWDSFQSGLSLEWRF